MKKDQIIHSSIHLAPEYYDIRVGLAPHVISLYQLNNRIFVCKIILL